MFSIFNTNANKRKTGFTLIELLVVIAVIGLLASIILVSVGPAREKAKDARRQSDIREIGLAMEMKFDDNSGLSYPTVDANGFAPPDLSPFLDNVSTNPNTGVAEYQWLKNDDDSKKFCVYTKLINPDPYIYFCASHMGIYSSVDEPTLDNCCF